MRHHFNFSTLDPYSEQDVVIDLHCSVNEKGELHNESEPALYLVVNKGNVVINIQAFYQEGRNFRVNGPSYICHEQTMNLQSKKITSSTMFSIYHEKKTKLFVYKNILTLEFVKNILENKRPFQYGRKWRSLERFSIFNHLYYYLSNCPYTRLCSDLPVTEFTSFTYDKKIELTFRTIRIGRPEEETTMCKKFRIEEDKEILLDVCFRKRGEIHRDEGPAVMVYNKEGKVIKEHYYLEGKEFKINK